MKRKYTPKSTASAKFAKNSQLFRPGYTRTSGTYGRFQPSGGELKFHDLSITSTPTNVGVVMADLLTIPQDTTTNGRIGREITIREFHMEGIVSKVAGSGTGVEAGPRALRLLLVQDKQCNGTQMLVDEVLATLAMNSFRNLENSKRFNILYDQRVILNPPITNVSGDANIVTVGSKKAVKFHKKCNIVINYDIGTTSGAIGTIRSNNLAFIVIQATGTTGALAHLHVRVRYSDK